MSGIPKFFIIIFIVILIAIEKVDEDDDEDEHEDEEILSRMIQVSASGSLPAKAAAEGVQYRALERSVRGQRPATQRALAAPHRGDDRRRHGHP
jgi:hypothetical protein